jgi:lysozyme family protein
MMFSEDFSKAFNHAMIYEVGAWFNANDPITKLGLINNKANCRACGFVNDPADTGGVTKYGIAQNKNPDIDVMNLNLDKALNIYFERYWLPAKCDKIASPLNVLHFDTAVNMGVGAAAKLLQTALGVTADGGIGPQTLAAIAAVTDPSALCTKYLNLKQARYDAIVRANPSQAKFAAGWRSRNEEMRKFLGVK